MSGSETDDETTTASDVAETALAVSSRAAEVTTGRGQQVFVVALIAVSFSLVVNPLPIFAFEIPQGLILSLALAALVLGGLVSDSVIPPRG